MDFYYAPGTVALATHISLEEAGAEYRAIPIDFSKGENNGKAFRKINPKGRVPALVMDEGILTETPAMLAYVAQTYPKANLAPLNNPFAFAQVQSFNSYLCSTLHVAHAHKMRGSRWADKEASFEDMRNKVPQTVAECYTYIEDHVFHGPYVVGETYTISDAYLFAVSGWMTIDGLDVNNFPKIKTHREMMLKRAAVQHVLESHPS